MEDKKMTREEFQKLIDQTLDEQLEKDLEWEKAKSSIFYEDLKDIYMNAFPTLSERDAYHNYMTLELERWKKEDELRQEVFEKTGIPPQEQRDREMMDKYGRKYISMTTLEEDIAEINKMILEQQKKEKEFLEKLTNDTDDNEPKPEEEQSAPETNNDDNNVKDDDSSNNWKWIVLFAIFLLGIGGCFGGLIMKGSKDAAESANSTYGQEQKNQPEVTTSQPNSENQPQNDEAVPKGIVELVANTPASETVTVEEAIEMSRSKKWDYDDKYYLKKNGAVYKLSDMGVSGEKLPLDIKTIESHTDLEDFFTYPERWYKEDLPGFAERYAEYVEALKEFDNGWVPTEGGTVFKEKGFTLRDTKYEDADLTYRILLRNIAQIRQIFKIHKEILIPLASQEIKNNVKNLNHPMFNSVEDFLGNKVKYKDTWWNRHNSNYKLEDFESDEINAYANELVKHYR